MTYEPSGPSAPFQATLAAARKGEAWALDSLAQRFYPTVERIVHHKLVTDLRASRPWLTARFSTGDVVQEVFHGVLRDLGAFAGETEEAFVGYLAMVVRNRIIDAIRFHEADRRDGRRSSSHSEEHELEGTGHDPASAVASDEQVQLLFEALKEFAPREQLLLRARIEGVASFGELAAQLGYGSESAARRAFYAAQARLSLLLKEEGGE